MTHIIISASLVAISFAAVLVQTVRIKKYRTCTHKLQQLMTTDELTGLYSRKGFDYQVEQLLAKYPDTSFYMIDMDINNFNFYNNVYGFEAGDKLLKNIGAILTDCCNEKECAARLQNDHFVALSSGSEIEVRNKIDIGYKLFLNQIIDKMIPAHFGLYAITDRSLPVHVMRDRARAAKRTVKHDFKTLVGVYDNDIYEQQLNKTKIISKFEPALINKEFSVVYQPKYNTKTEKIAGAEALVRWQCPNGVEMSPGSFIQLFEHNGLITRLDFYVFEQVCASLRALQEQHITPVCVSVNFSRIHLFDTSFCKKLSEIMDKYRIPPELIEIEMTESVFLENQQLFNTVAKQLHDMGLQISIDDFGSGFSSLNMLKETDFDIIKIDQAFFQTHGENEDKALSVLKCIFNLSKELNLKTVAEGVETQEQVEWLRSSNCDLIQGFYYSKPVPLHKLIPILCG